MTINLEFMKFVRHVGIFSKPISHALESEWIRAERVQHLEAVVEQSSRQITKQSAAREDETTTSFANIHRERTFGISRQNNEAQSQVRFICS